MDRSKPTPAKPRRSKAKPAARVWDKRNRRGVLSVTRTASRDAHLGFQRTAQSPSASAVLSQRSARRLAAAVSVGPALPMSFPCTASRGVHVIAATGDDGSVTLMRQFRSGKTGAATHTIKLGPSQRKKIGAVLAAA